MEPAGKTLVPIKNPAFMRVEPWEHMGTSDLQVGFAMTLTKSRSPAVAAPARQCPAPALTRQLIYRRDTVLSMLGVSKSTLRRWMLDEGFPLPRQLGPRAVGWIAQEVDAWLVARPVTSMPTGSDGDA